MTDYKQSPILMDIFSDQVSTGPRSITIKINSICNLNCECCFDRSPSINNNPSRNMLPLSLIKNIVEDAIEISSTKKIILSSGGETSLHPEILQIIDYIKKEKKLSLQINSNLTFDKRSLRLGFAEVDKLLVNMCAHDENVYFKQCRPSSNKSYRNLINNLKLFSILYKRTGKPKIELNCVVTRHNYGDLKKMIEFADSFHILQLRFVAMGPLPETKKLLVSENEFNGFKEFIRNMSCKYKVKMRVTEYVDIKENNAPQLNSCFAGWFHALIKSDGSVIFCHRNFELKAGNVRDDSFKNIWFSEKANTLRSKLKYDLDSCRPPFMQCRSCDHTKEFLEIEDDCKQYYADIADRIQ